MNQIDTTEIQYQCRHIFTGGRRCASPTLRSPAGHEPFCYYHHTTRRPAQPSSRVPHSRAQRVSEKESTFTLPIPEDPSSIQLAIGEVLRRIASNEIDSRRAGLLLYGLQIASLNLKRDLKTPDSARKNAATAPAAFVTEIVHDPGHGLLAPPAELYDNEPIGSAQRLYEELMPGTDDPLEDGPSEDATTQPGSVTQPSPIAPPNLTIDLQACAVSRRETIFRMSNFIPKPPSPRSSGLGPKAQKLAALREKAAAQANSTSAHSADAATGSAPKPKNTVAKKTAFQRKAT